MRNLAMFSWPERKRWPLKSHVFSDDALFHHFIITGEKAYQDPAQELDGLGWTDIITYHRFITWEDTYYVRTQRIWPCSSWILDGLISLRF